MPRLCSTLKSGSRDFRQLWILFGISLAVRFIYLVEASHSPYFHTPVFDAQNYDLLARNLLTHGPTDPQLFWQPLFYPLYLASAYSVTGGSILAVKVFQCMLGATNCVLTCLLGRRLLGPRVGLIAGYVLAFYGPVVFYHAELAANVWAEFWALLLLLLLTATPLPPWRWFILGCVGALSTLTRTTFLPFVVLSAVYLCWCEFQIHRQLAPIAKKTAFATAGFGLILLPAACLCAQVTGRFTFVPSSAGINLYLGNNLKSVEMESIRGWEVIHLRQEAESHGHFDVWAENAYFADLAQEYLLSHPLHAARNWLRKAAAFISSREVPSYDDVYLQRTYSSVMSLLVWRVGSFGFPFGVILPLAVVGLAVCFRRLPAALLLFITLDFLSITSAHVFTRTRTTVIPLLAILAAAGILWLIAAARERNKRALIACAACVVIMLAATLPGPFGRESFPPSELELSAGFYAQQMNRHEDAAGHYRRALEMEPSNASAHFNLATVMTACGDYEPAISEYNESIRVAPLHSEFHYNLANALVATHRVPQAVEEYRRTIELKPHSSEAHFNLAYLLTDMREPKAAIEHYREAVRIRPHFTNAWVNLGLLLEEQTDATGAEHAYLSALRVEPEHPVAQHGLGRLHSQIGCQGSRHPRFAKRGG